MRQPRFLCLVDDSPLTTARFASSRPHCAAAPRPATSPRFGLAQRPVAGFLLSGDHRPAHQSGGAAVAPSHKPGRTSTVPLVAFRNMDRILPRVRSRYITGGTGLRSPRLQVDTLPEHGRSPQPSTHEAQANNLTYTSVNFKVVSPSLSTSPEDKTRGMFGFNFMDPPSTEWTMVPLTDDKSSMK